MHQLIIKNNLLGVEHPIYFFQSVKQLKTIFVIEMPFTFFKSNNSENAVYKEFISNDSKKTDNEVVVFCKDKIAVEGIKERLINMDQFKSPVDDNEVYLIGVYITQILSRNISDIYQTNSKDGGNSDESFVFSRKGEDIYKKIIQFYQLIKTYAQITKAELIASTIFLERLIEREKGNTANPEDIVIVTESNLGTILLCSLMISIKCHRDYILSNVWWSNLLNIPLYSINISEVVFLNSLNYDLFITSEEFESVVKRIYNCARFIKA